MQTDSHFLDAIYKAYAGRFANKYWRLQLQGFSASSGPWLQSSRPDLPRLARPIKILNIYIPVTNPSQSQRQSFGATSSLVPCSLHLVLHLTGWRQGFIYPVVADYLSPAGLSCATPAGLPALRHTSLPALGAVTSFANWSWLLLMAFTPSGRMCLNI